MNKLDKMVEAHRASEKQMQDLTHSRDRGGALRRSVVEQYIAREMGVQFGLAVAIAIYLDVDLKVVVASLAEDLL